MSQKQRSECAKYREGECRYIVDLKQGVATLIELVSSIEGPFNVPKKLGGYRVTGISEWTFFLGDRLSSITIPESVVDIKDLVFGDCHALSSIVVDNSNPRYCSLDGVLFDKEMSRLIKCPPLCVKGVYEVPAGVKEIAEEAFSNCFQLTGVSLPHGLAKIGSRAFIGCLKLTAVEIPDSVAEIGVDAFDTTVNPTLRVGDGNANLRVEDGVLFDKGRTTIKSLPYNNSGEYTIPANVRDIEGLALKSCYGLTAIHVAEGSDSFASLDGVLFSKDMGELLLIPPQKEGICRVPVTVTKMEREAYSGYCGFKGFEVDEGNACFHSLDGALFSKDMRTLLFYPPVLFGVCKVPASVTDIHCGVYSVNPSFQFFDVDEGNTCFRSVEGVLYTKDMTELIRCPVSQAGDFHVPFGVEQIRCFAFAACSQVTSIQFPASVNDIDYLFFVDEGCTSLTAIDVDEGNSTYRCVDGALFNRDLTELIRCPAGRAGVYTIPPSVVLICSFAFNGCGKLERIEVPKSVKVEGVSVWEGVVGEIVHEA